MPILKDTFDVEVTVRLKVRIANPCIHTATAQARKTLIRHGLDRTKWDEVKVETLAETAWSR